ncbi:hypothetical protein [Alkalibacillus haloalkaliphilus]|uniref:Uncharacterized protein n=1 Tax=Alkalibacillus haloalkaliphilus TaxID=94136 RepID=A0A511W359_9BACI|nr:hypothetical protein [Alkalibacillus haloalkaliphilus]GEN44523.1 hypothetical protein AHA02nite_02990 [Alkalibacillus haloalkaliphilus]
MGNLLKKVILSLIIILLALHPIVTSLVYAVEPWSGESWEGSPWEGDPWDSSELQWQGKPWESSETGGTPWEGETEEGHTWNQDGFNNGGSWSGNHWQLSTWYLNSWSHPGIMGDPWSRDGFTGDQSQGLSWTNEGSFRIEDHGEADSNSKNISPYDIGKYVVDDVLMSGAELVGDNITHDNMNRMNYNSSPSYGLRFKTNIMINGLNLWVGDNHAINAAHDIENSVNAAQGIKASRDIRRYDQKAGTRTQSMQRKADQLSDIASNSRDKNTKRASPHPAAVGALSKLNVVASAVGTGFSVIDTGVNSVEAYKSLTSNDPYSEKVSTTARVGESAGNAMLSAGVVAAAVPALQPFAGFLLVGGGGLLLASRTTRFLADHWKGNIKDTGKAIASKTADKVKSTFNTVKGWFS